LVQDYIVGTMTYELGGRFGIDRRMVSAILRQRGVPGRRRGLSHDQVDEAVRLYRLGWSLTRVGKRFAVDPGTVRSAACVPALVVDSTLVVLSRRPVAGGGTRV
jgi:hypothetical protein